MHIILVEYGSEAERKKVEYLVGQWQENTQRPKGYPIVVEDRVFQDFYASVVSKIPKERVASFRLEPVEPEIESKSSMLRFSFGLQKNMEQVSSFITYLINKRKGIFLSSMGDVRSYRLVTKKENVQVNITFISIHPVGMVLEVVGTGDGVDLIEKEFSREIEIFGGEKVGE